MFEHKFIFFLSHHSIRKPFFVTKISTQSARFPLVGGIIGGVPPSMNFFERRPSNQSRCPPWPPPKNKALTPPPSTENFCCLPRSNS